MATRRLLPLLVLCLGCPVKDGGVTIHNTDPNASIDLPLDGASFSASEAIEFVGTVGDSEDHPTSLIVSWSSDVDGVLQSGIPSDDDGSTLLTTGSLSPGGHTIVLHVADPSGKTAEDNISILVVDVDAAPVINILRPSDDDVGVETEEFSFEAVVTDIQDVAPDLAVFFWLDTDGDQELLCEAAPSGEGLATCSASLDAGTYDIAATVEDTDGNIDEDRFSDFVVLTAEEVDDDGDGFTEIEGDCDDADDNIHPDAAELANGVDDDCDGEIDEGTDDFDDDGDGFSELEGDCNDDDETIHPGAEELLNDVDDDCDGDIDEGTDAYDDDGDCFCEEEPCSGTISTDCEEVNEGDCDDGDEDIHPDATEICDDIDNDCDLDVDADDADTDSDGDGYSACDSEDCDDDDIAVSPDATEVCDGIDNDCDGDEDEDDATDASTWYADVDDDGYGDADAMVVSCYAPEGYISDSSDCDDLSSTVHPGGTEVCDEDDTDEDCDGDADDDDSGGASGTTMWFRDMDSDGHGDSSDWTYACDEPSGYVDNNDDCDDWNDDAYPGRTETCDDADNDCDGEIDEEDSTGCETYYLDEDGDGFGHESDRRCLCEPDGAADYDVTNNDDCCDESASAYPYSSNWTDSEVCGSYDMDCDGVETRRWDRAISCDVTWSGCSETSGWYGWVPLCGSTYYWGDCDSFPICVAETDGTRRQECR